PFFTGKNAINISAATPFTKNPFKLFSAACKLFYGFFQSLIALKKIQPHFVLGFGSYHTFPILLAAKILNIPIALFESNAIMGRVNRFFAKKATIYSPFEYTNGYTTPFPLQSKKISREIAHQYYNLDPEKKTLLITGGSQGADFLNALELDYPQIIHLTGKGKKVPARDKKSSNKIVTKPFEEKMEMAWAAADIAVTRAGAGTCAEILFNEVPAIMIPYPYATDFHQTKNSLFIQNVVCGGVFIPQDAATSEKINAYLKQDEEIATWRKKIKEYKKNQAQIKLAQLLQARISSESVASG
ncbi:MAG: glycosyltransferase, partial [Simkaniaceae bacterium]|nr:glycosyltransferase [Simkaniaceae bacterium]